MKKKRRNLCKRSLLAIMLSVMIVFCASCVPGGNEDVPSSLDGTKVLTRPASYNFGTAVGDNASQYYYNIFANFIFDSLYKVYNADEIETDIYDSEKTKNKREMIYDGLDNSNYTYSVEKETSSGNIYYLYDSIRYTITDVDTYKDSEGNVTKQELILDKSTAWNWSVGGDTFFDKNDNFIIKNDRGIIYEADIGGSYDDWTNIVTRADESDFPNYQEYFSGERKGVDGKDDVVNYYESPYYQKMVEKTEVIAVNYFQDAMEYAVYLFVLGYDFVDENGRELTNGEGRLFDFVVKTDGSGMVNGMTVKGWDNNGTINTENASEVDIVDALGYVKTLYESTGGYVGITTSSENGKESNKDQIIRLIKSKVIGLDASGKVKGDTFTVSKNTYQTNAEGNVEGNPQTSSQSFNRNYDKILNNIVDYACSEAPIGEYVDENGVRHKLTLDNPYLASEITDYDGDYFFTNGTVGDDGNSAGTDFLSIAPAEYQSIVIYPKQRDLDKGVPLVDIWLAFEYFDETADNFDELPTKVRADFIEIDVGLRFYDNSANVVHEYEPYTLKLDYGRYDSEEFSSPSQNWVQMGSNPDVAHVVTPSDELINLDQHKGIFKTDIGNNAINPKIYGTQVGESVYSMSINGTTNAREYYQMNNSRHYGKYGTLNAQKFAGESGCDFVEIYFDIHKDKGDPNVNYNFKVAFKYVGFAI